MTADNTKERRGFRASDIWLIFGRRGSLKQLSILGALVIIIMIFQIWTNGTTLSSGNVINLVQAYSFILILSVGMVMVIITGHIDLSVGSVAAFVGIVVATSMRDWGLPWWAGILLGIALGAAIGAFQGFWVAYVGDSRIHRDPCGHDDLARCSAVGRPGADRRCSRRLPPGALRLPA